VKVLVCGGRDYVDAAHVFEVLTKLHDETPIRVLIHGGASGVDTHAGHWAEDWVHTTVYHADWATHGRAAGPIRNQKMLDEQHPDLVVAFPGGRGTADMMTRARRAGVRVIEVASRTPHAKGTP
jgi:NADPH:quinone reductase-like Zn-dependent oxidoreductase